VREFVGELLRAERIGQGGESVVLSGVGEVAALELAFQHEWPLT